MGVIATVETHLVELLRDAFGDRVREVESVPAQLSPEELTRVLKAAPALYVAFLGGRRSEARGLAFTASMGIYAVAANAAGEEARRHGDARTIGAYDLVEITAALVDRHRAPEIGTLEVREITNLFSAAFTKAGRTVYAVVLDLPLALDDQPDLSLLDDFATFHADWDVTLGNVSDEVPAVDADASDTITLETA